MAKKWSNTFFINTLIIILTNFFVKLLGLVNKIAITRILGPTGMSLYVLSFPTIMLFISMAGFSLNITISKLVAESISTKRYSPKKIVHQACKYALFLSFIIMIIYLLLLKPLTIYSLKNPDLYLPLLAGAPLIMLVGLSDGLKGYFVGIQKINVASFSNLIEQIGRISFSLLMLYLTLPLGVIKATFFCLLALSIGEIWAIIFCLIKIKKYPLIDYPNTSGEKRAILKMALPNTLSKLIGNFTYFLEPILYTLILSSLGYEVSEIQTNYTILDAYTIPLLTFISFLPAAIATVIIPSVSKASSLNNEKVIHYYIRKALTFCLIPSLILAINLYFFNSEYMNLIYGTISGTKPIKYLAFIFICYYLHLPVVAILQACGASHKVFITSTIINFLRLFLIIILSVHPLINLQSVLIATTITMVIGFIVNFYQLKKLTNFKINLKNLFNISLITICSIGVTILLLRANVYYLIISLINGSIIIGLAFFQKIIRIESLSIKPKFKKTKR